LYTVCSGSLVRLLRIVNNNFPKQKRGKKEEDERKKKGRRILAKKEIEVRETSGATLSTP
jgi:hypothetical protein